MFQSTHSLRSATPTGELVTIVETVSIHALLAECDTIESAKLKPPTSFNPRTPCGVRPGATPDNKTTKRFQSTHSLRSAT